jgi:NAD dependent epimerase/dehydratase family enzyme
MREFARTLGRVLHRPALFPVPAFALRLRFGEGASVMLTGQRVLPVRAQAEGFHFAHPTLEGALADLTRRV